MAFPSRSPPHSKVAPRLCASSIHSSRRSATAGLTSRSDHRLLVGWISHCHSASSLHQGFCEFLLKRPVHKHTLGRDAGLARLDECAQRDAVCSRASGASEWTIAAALPPSSSSTRFLGTRALISQPTCEPV